MFREFLKTAALEFGIDLTDSQLDLFDKFYSMVLDWNSKINLTNLTEPRDFALKNVIDSLSAWRAIEKSFPNKNISVIDVGSGAGFPGVPLKILHPEIKLTSIDSLGKRVKFLDAVRIELQLDEFTCIQARAEDLGRLENYREKFDAAISRAVAKLPILLELCIPLVKVNGIFVAMKGKKFLEELGESRKAVEDLGGEFLETIEIKLPELDDTRALITSQKIRQTSKKFPRQFGIIEKKPL